MSEPYYIAGAERAKRVHQLFGRIAARYDLINDLQSLGMHRLWKRRLVQEAVLHTGSEAAGFQKKILDLCCGTGDIALALAEKGLAVWGVDFSEEMLVIAQKRARKKNLSSIRWVQQDVLTFDEGAGSYDVVSCAYGLRNLADIPGAIGHIYGLLKPGGVALILEFGKPENVFLRWLYRLYLKLVVPVFGLLFCRDARAYSYILDSLEHYPAQRGVDRLLRGAGFVETSWSSFVGGTMTLHRAVK